MKGDLRRLLRWLRRARPPAHDLWAALAAGLVASLTNVALVVGAVALLVASASRPGLQAVLGALIVIELFAFLRSPLRFAERMSSHRLGFEAVTVWRRWLVEVIGGLDYSQWRRYRSGDLLERALRDTDELQDLWLRCAIPVSTSSFVMLLGDATVALLAPHGRWWVVVLIMALAQLAGFIALALSFEPLLRADRALRSARGHYRGELVELSRVTPELSRLGRIEYVQQRSDATTSRLRSAEARSDQLQRVANIIGPLVAMVSLAGMDFRPASSPVWIVVAGMLAISNVESFAILRAGLDTAIAVSAAAERLEELDDPRQRGRRDWPIDATIRLEEVTFELAGRVLINGATLTLAPGRRLAITGVSGAGKSALLRLIANLEAPTSGAIWIGDTRVEEIDEVQLRNRMAYVPSEPGLMRGFAIDVIALGRASRRDPLEDLRQLHIAAEPTTRWENLSRGETERVAVVRALAGEPVVYLLDEPTGALGSLETKLVLDVLAKTQASFIIATHDPQVIDWCHQTMVLAHTTLDPLSH